MNSQRDQAYLKTRVGVFAARLFSHEDIQVLKQMSLHQLGERFDLLPIFEQEIDTRQKSGLVEQALLQRLMNELKVLLRPLSGRSRGLILYWPRKYELYNLKTLIQGKWNNLGMQEIRHNLYALPENIRLPHEALLQAENVQEMLRQLERGPYSQIARQARNVYEEQHENFSLGAAIDRLYYTGMLAQANITDCSDKRGLKKAIGCMVDRQNILWLLRYRLVYHFAPSETYYLLIPYGGQIQRDDLMALANIDGLDTVISQLPEPFHSRLAGSVHITDARQRLDQWVSDQLRQLMLNSQDAVVSALCYLIIRDMDIWRLYAIIQGKLLEMEPSLVDQAVSGKDHSGMHSEEVA
ncbi:MAG: V-type ATPase subunit [Candidatus Thiodiazotropha sp. LLP2]